MAGVPLRGVRERWSRLSGQARYGVPVAGGVLVAVTLLRDGTGANGIAMAMVQVILVALAVIDFATRRLPNVITGPTALAALVLRAAFERAHLLDAALYGLGALGVFAVLFIVMRGGFGMGDVKLASMLGFVLGSAVVPALVIGTVAGGVVAVALIALHRVSRHSTIAYGPYLALGGMLAILLTSVPALA